MKFAFLFATVVLLLIVGVTGCGGETPGTTVAENQNSPTKDETKPLQPVRISGDRIQIESGQLIANLDGRRLEVAPPKGWSAGPRQANQLVWFRLKNKAAQVPRILVSVEEPLPGFATVTEQNVVEFAQAIKKEVDEQELKLVEKDVLPIIAGEQPCARYVVGGKLGTASVDRQVLVTQANGRRYRVELQSYPNSFKEYRDAGYSVMASMKFHDPGDGKANDEIESKTDGEKADSN